MKKSITFYLLFVLISPFFPSHTFSQTVNQHSFSAGPMTSIFHAELRNRHSVTRYPDDKVFSSLRPLNGFGGQLSYAYRKSDKWAIAGTLNYTGRKNDPFLAGTRSELFKASHQNLWLEGQIFRSLFNWGKLTSDFGFGAAYQLSWLNYVSEIDYNSDLQMVVLEVSRKERDVEFGIPLALRFNFQLTPSVSLGLTGKGVYFINQEYTVSASLQVSYHW